MSASDLLNNFGHTERRFHEIFSGISQKLEIDEESKFYFYSIDSKGEQPSTIQ